MPLSPKGGYLFLCYQLIISLQLKWRRTLVLINSILQPTPSIIPVCNTLTPLPRGGKQFLIYFHFHL